MSRATQEWNAAFVEGRRRATQLERRMRRRRVPRSAYSFDWWRLPEHGDLVLGSYIQEPFMGLGGPAVPMAPAPMTTDPAAATNLLQSLATERGYTLIPSRDMRDYVRNEMLTAALGFTAGLTIGALLGPVALNVVKSVLGRR